VSIKEKIFAKRFGSENVAIALEEIKKQVQDQNRIANVNFAKPTSVLTGKPTLRIKPSHLDGGR